MILNKKINTNQLIAWLLLIYFAASTLFLTFHSFSHQLSSQTSHHKVLKSSDQNISDEQCGLCALFIAQNQIFLFAAAVFAISSFYLATVFLIKNNCRLPYLVYSNPPRAPPYFS